MVDEERTSSANEVFEALELFALQQTKYVHVRSTRAGCLLFQLDRVASQGRPGNHSKHA
jgi:hypothetical protein